MSTCDGVQARAVHAAHVSGAAQATRVSSYSAATQQAGLDSVSLPGSMDATGLQETKTGRDRAHVGEGKVR